MRLCTLIIMGLTALLCGVLFRAVGDNFTGLANAVFSILVLCVGFFGIYLAFHLFKKAEEEIKRSAPGGKG